MEVLSVRINSFKKSKRVKNPDKPSSTTTLKWPHPPDFKANPEALAEAGFYYDPAYDDPDNVTCYICEKELAGWEEDDDPFLLHSVKCGQHCCWARVRCGLTADIDQSGRFIASDKTRNPTHKLMEKARLETFRAGKGWIHDQAKEHGASSAMMARAGFVYTPQHSGDDLATCLYCGTSLSGWDSEDDPMDEHRKRAAKSDIPCAFFLSLEPPSRAQSTKPASKTHPKPPSRSTSKAKYQDFVVPTKTYDGEEDESDAVEATKAAKSTAKTPRKPRSTSSSRKSSAKTPKPKPRNTSRSGLKDVAEDEEEDSEIEAPKTAKKKAPSRSKSAVKSDVPTDQDEGDNPQPSPATKKKPGARSKSVAKARAVIEDEDDVEVAPPLTVKKAKSHPKLVVKSDVEAESEHEVAEVPKPSRKTRKPAQESADEQGEDVPRKSSRTKAKASAVPDIEAVPRKVSRTQAKLSVAPMTTEQSRKSSRSNSSKAKAPDSEQEDIPEPSEQEAPPRPAPKPKHQRTASKSKPKVPITIPETESADHEEEPVVVAPKKKSSAKSKHSRPVEVKNLFNEGVTMESNVLPPLSPPSPSEPTDLPALFVPKRNTATSAAPGKQLSQPPARPKVASQSKPASQAPQTRKVVEISSDEESDTNDSKQDRRGNDVPQGENIKTEAFPQPRFTAPPRPTSSRTNRKKSVVVETIQPVEETDTFSVPAPAPSDSDVNMDHVEPDNDHQMDDAPAPSTPLRPTAQPAHSKDDIPSQVQPVPEPPAMPLIPSQNGAPPIAPTEPPFMPPLSKLPFTPLQSLTDAELDMTVEEWIRYQMDVEFDKFRRDGERELQQFRKKAEEVRRVIEGV